MKHLILISAVLLLLIPQSRPLPEPTNRIKWSASNPDHDQVYTDGNPIRLIESEGLTVALSGFEGEGYIVAEVTVVNNSESRINVLPEDFFILLWDEKGQMSYSYSIPPEKVSKKVKGRGGWKAFFRAVAAGISANPDLQDRAAAENQRTKDENAAKADAVMDTALLANTVYPNTYYGGVVYFPRKKFKVGSFVVYINKTSYEFAFSPKN